MICSVEHVIKGNQILAFVSGIMVSIVGWVHISQLLDGISFCSAPLSCVGPYLVWNDNNFIADTNGAWRSVFSIAPSLFLVNWLPVLCGATSAVMHVEGFSIPYLCGTWLRNAAWHMFLALFCSFGYSGDLGIIVGFMCSLVSLLSVIFYLASAGKDAHPTTMAFQVHIRSCGKGDAVMTTLARWTSFGNGLILIVVGFIHVFVNQFGQWCNNGTQTCIGPLLVWSTVEPFVQDVNGAFGNWRSFFSLDPNVVIPIWGPLFFGIVTASAHITNWHVWQWTQASWPRVSLYFIFLAFFTSFGYTGNLGILLGFSCVFTSILAVFIVLIGNPAPTVMTITVGRPG